MGDFSFGQTVGTLKYALDGSATSHGVIANNIANVNTPHFKRSDVTFKEALAATEPRYDDSEQLATVTTDPRHIPVGPSFEAQPFEITTTVDDTQQMRVDGSNVDVDQEMAKLSLNSSYGSMMAQMLQVQYGRIHSAIKEQVS